MIDIMYHYAGVIAYFEDNAETNYRMKALATLLPGLTDQLLNEDTEPLDRVYNALHSRVARKLKDNPHVFQPIAAALPEAIAPFQHKIHLGYGEIDMQQHIRLDIPVVSNDEKLFKDISENALYTVLLVLFGENLIDIEAFVGTSHDHAKYLTRKELYR